MLHAPYLIIFVDMKTMFKCPFLSVHESELKKVIVHNEYDPSGYHNDIALIQLAECVPTLDQFRAPICLPTCKF